jgi:hypothetical protein
VVRRLHAALPHSAEPRRLAHEGCFGNRHPISCSHTHCLVASAAHTPHSTSFSQQVPFSRTASLLGCMGNWIIIYMQPHGETFAAEWLQSIGNWSAYWLNDREQARRPWVCTPDALKIDRWAAQRASRCTPHRVLVLHPESTRPCIVTSCYPSTRAIQYTYSSMYTYRSHPAVTKGFLPTTSQQPPLLSLPT